MQRHQRNTPTPFHPDNARNGTITVWDAPGGYTDDYRRDLQASLDAGYDINVLGTCQSACTQIAGPEFRGYVRTGANPDGQITIDPRRTAFGVHQLSNNYGEKNLPATIFYLGTFPQEALERSGVPNAQDIDSRYYGIRGDVMLEAIENMQRDGRAPIRERRGLFGGNRRD